MELAFLHALQGIHTPFLNAIMILVSHLGDRGTLFVFIGVGLCLFKDTRKMGLTILLSMIFALFLNEYGLKHLFLRARPAWVDHSVPMLISIPTDYSFPSGHTFASFAFATSVYLHSKMYGRWAYGLATLIGFSRLYLFVHYPSDVLGGMIFGIVAGYVSYKIINYLFRDHSVNDKMPHRTTSYSSEQHHI